jgi:RHS repeat-associated protein
VSNLGYAYGDGMNLTAINDNVAPANNIALFYNQANRLQNADGTWGQSVSYYDEVGNRTYDINQVGAVTTTRVQGYDLASNRLMNITENSATLRTYTYDGGGNIITDVRPGESFAFTYNKRNRPISVTRNAVAYASYGYNALEQLVTRSTSAAGGPVGTIHYIYDLDGHLIAEADAITGATTREYIWAAANDNTPIDLPLAVIDGVNTATPLTLWVHTDHLGRPTRMTDSTKATVWTAAYKAWGEPTILSGTKLLNLRFPGQYFQIETGLAYNWNRHYDTTTGRYTQPDPLGFVDGPAIYAYAGNSPWMNSDREGLAPKYVKPPNPNQRKGAEDRQPDGDRERNAAHPDAEEHSVKPKGGVRFPNFRGPRVGPYLFMLNPCLYGIAALCPSMDPTKAKFTPEPMNAPCYGSAVTSKL